MIDLDTAEAPAPQPISYVTYDAAGNLTGSYLQMLQPEHEACHIEVDEAQRLNWCLYRASEARDGLEALPPTPPPAPAVPQQITNGQAREALLDAGMLDLIAPAIAAIVDEGMRKRVEIAWEYRPTVERNSPFVAYMAQALSLTDAQVDQLFIDGGAL